MLYREMPKTKDQLSILGFGCMRLPGRQTSPDEEKSISLIRRAIDGGVNYVDTAWPYHGGKSEVVLGKALKDGYREKVKIADKLPQWLCANRADMDSILDRQLERLDVDRIDYYLIHAVDGASWKKAKENGAIDFLNDAKAVGKIVNAGFSFHGPCEEFKGIIDDYDWDFAQIQFNIIDKNYQAGLEGLEYACSKDIGIIIMEPLRGGSLAGKQPVEVEKIYQSVKPERSNVDWALRWIWNHPGIVTVLSGMNAQEQLDENMSIAKTAEINSMSELELNAVDKAAKAFRSLMAVPCTGCQYCMPCPAGVDIPTSFSFFNSKFLFKNGFSSRCMYLMQLSGKPALASQCVECGKCVKHCPQNIDIPRELKKVSKAYEGWTTKPLGLLLQLVMRGGRRKS